MTPRTIRTVDIARMLGVHVNTIRLYEREDYLPPIARAANGYRRYTPLHVEHARLVHLALHWPWVGDKHTLITLVRAAAQGNLGMAMEYAYRHLARVRIERTNAEAAVAFLERWATGIWREQGNSQAGSNAMRMNIGEAARYLDVSVDMLRNWERNGLISVPRDAVSRYRVYGSAEFGRLRVIRILLQSGYSLMAILRMMQQFDTGGRKNLAAALELPPEESANEHIEVIADRWLSSLLELEERAHAIIHQIDRLMQMTA